MTERASVRFRVTQYANEQPWIVVEPLGGGRLDMFKKVIGLDLAAGTSFEKAARICDLLNENIEQIGET
ncbi:hypothetical protein BST63_10590 [Bradyrhizobium canariense]|uniref:Uncharacterized protein n=1 Tax=Bradyrhizobium canariense TaxID=255045 RepID=A0ABX3X729_9BRAD|nr:hypothetical protein BSR47_11670 [Bradyrhizobium canariense]OSJ31085.1 hypothetical protein BST63_10590 [Bradyrhizobium canariense]